MRKNLFTLIALSACALVACNKQENVVINETPEAVEMTIIAGDSSTKTALSGSSIIWSGTEKLKVIEAVTGGTDNNKFFSKDSSEGVSGDEGQTMTFNVTLDAHDGATSFQYVALYPHSSLSKANSLSNIAVNSLSAQNPSATSFDPAADFLISQVSDASASQPTSINMAFARKIAIAEMTIKNLGSSDDITSVTFSAIKKDGGVYKDIVVAGRSKVDFTTSSVDYGSNVKSYVINMDYTGDNVKANTSTGAKTYFTCYPFSLAADDKFTVVVETASHRFTREITLTGAQTLEFTPGDVSKFSVNMTGVAGDPKAVSLRYAELTREDVYGFGITTNSYSAIDLDKTHGDRWMGYVSYFNSGFGIRRADDGHNDSFVKLPDFTEEISTITVTLSSSITAGSEKALLLESASDTYTGSIASLDAVTDQMEYVFNVASDNINTAYLRCKGAPAYIKKVAVVTKKTEDRSTLSSPSTVTASLSGNTGIKVDWSTVTDAVGYNVEYTNTTADPDEVNSVYVAGQSTSTTTISGLPSDTEYSIRVKAVADPYVNFDSNYTAAGSSVTTKAGTTYTLYTGELVEGDYIVVGQSHDVAMKNVISSNRLSYDSITISTNVITDPDAAYVWHISANSTYWNIYNAAVTKYAASTGAASKASLQTDKDNDKSLWSVAKDGTGSSTKYIFTNKLNTTNSVNAQLNYNNTYGFACYASGKVRLYKKD